MTLKRGKDKKLMPKLLSPSDNVLWCVVKYYSGRNITQAMSTGIVLEIRHKAIMY